MSSIRIHPSHLKGTIAIPPSKSLAHRAIICASLAKGISRIDHIEYSQDIIATINAMEALGTKIEKYDDYLMIDGTSTFTKSEVEIDCKESGSTVRFMIPITLVKQCKAHFTGSGKLGSRPLDVYYNIFDLQHITYSYVKDVLDLNIEGHLMGTTYKVAGNISSQFITGLLFALPLLKEDSVIEITTNLESKGYIDLTLDILKTYGIQVINEDYQRFIIPGNQKYKVHDYYVEADYSQAAFYLVADALGNEVVLKGLNINSMQGDRVVLDLLESMNCSLINKDEGILLKSNGLKPIVIDASGCPDIIPVMTLALCKADGHSKVINALRLRIKECDRLKAVATELNKLNASIVELEEGLEVDPSRLKGNEVSSWNDHRMAMTLAIASTILNEDLVIDNRECVKKSYPSFWDDFKMLGGNYE